MFDNLKKLFQRKTLKFEVNSPPNRNVLMRRASKLPVRRHTVVENDIKGRFSPIKEEVNQEQGESSRKPGLLSYKIPYKKTRKPLPVPPKPAKLIRRVESAYSQQLSKQNVVNVDRTIYQNDEFDESAECSKFSSSSGASDESLIVKPSTSMIPNDMKRSMPTFTLDKPEDQYDYKSAYSFAVDPTKIFEQELSEILGETFTESSCDRIFSKCFSDSSTFFNHNIQSTAEAFNEYIRLKHTRSVIEKMSNFYSSHAKDAHDPQKIMKNYFNNIHSFITEAMNNLEKDFPHLHKYSKRRANKKLDRRRLSNVKEEEHVNEYALVKL